MTGKQLYFMGEILSQALWMRLGRTTGRAEMRA